MAFTDGADLPVPKKAAEIYGVRPPTFFRPWIFGKVKQLSHAFGSFSPPTLLLFPFVKPAHSVLPGAPMRKSM